MNATPTLSAGPANTLGMQQLVALTGDFPMRGGGGGGGGGFVLGMIQSYAGDNGVFGAPGADGQMLPIANNPALYSVFGTAFGGDGARSFALPNLAGRTPVGGLPVGQPGQGSLTLSYLIAPQGVQAPFTGSIIAFGGNFAPAGWLTCDGSLLPIPQFIELFSVIGTTFGGDGATNFALPNLSGGAAVGTGTGPGIAPVALGQKVPGAVPGIGLAYLICSSQGLYPPPSGNGSFPDNQQFLGQVLASAGGAVPQGWLPCDGRLLPISNYQPLFMLIGTRYGGDGATDFALPDLRGRMLAGL